MWPALHDVHAEESQAVHCAPYLLVHAVHAFVAESKKYPDWQSVQLEAEQAVHWAPNVVEQAARRSVCGEKQGR